jgi:hypothetical protein
VLSRQCQEDPTANHTREQVNITNYYPIKEIENISVESLESIVKLPTIDEYKSDIINLKDTENPFDTFKYFEEDKSFKLKPRSIEAILDLNFGDMPFKDIYNILYYPYFQSLNTYIEAIEPLFDRVLDKVELKGKKFTFKKPIFSHQYNPIVKEVNDNILYLSCNLSSNYVTQLHNIFKTMNLNIDRCGCDKKFNKIYRDYLIRVSTVV